MAGTHLKPKKPDQDGDSDNDIQASTQMKEDQSIGLTKPKKKRSRKATGKTGDNNDDNNDNSNSLATKVWKKDFSSTKAAAIKRCYDTKKQIRLIESSSQMLSLDITAGYVGFKDVTSLRNWFATPNIHSRILEWAELVKYRHDLSLKVTQTGTQSQITVELTKTIMTLMHWAEGGKPTAVEDIENARLARDPSSYGKGEAGKSAVPYVNIASSAMTLLLSPDGPLLQRRLTTEQQLKSSHFLGWRWEDWSRAIHAVKCAAKDLARKTNSSTSTSDRVVTTRECPAVLPNFLTSEDIDGVIGEGLLNEEDELATMQKFDDEIMRTRALRRYEHLLAASNPEDRMVAGLGLSTISDIIRNTDPSKLVKNTTVLEKIIRDAFKKTPERIGILNGKTARPKVNKWALLDFCEDLSSRVKVSWDEQQITNARSRALLEHRSSNLPDIEEVARLENIVQQDEATGGVLPLGRVQCDDEISKDKGPLDKQKLKAFSDLLNNFMANVSAPFPSIQEARAWGGFGPDEPLIIKCARPTEDGRPVTLLPYQLIAAYYMYQQENTPIHASLIALACGLGKTLVTLFFIWRSVHHRKLHNQGKDKEHQTPYAVSLIIVPGASIEVWYLDLEKFFPGVLKMFAWYGSLTTVKSEKRRETLISPPADALQDHLDAFDPYDPETGLNIIATAHTTWYKRALGTCLETELVPDVRRRAIAPNNAGNIGIENSTDDADEDDSETEDCPSDAITELHSTTATNPHAERLRAEQDEARRTGRAFYCKIIYKFWRTIIDEAHLLRNLDTYLAEAVMQAQKENCHFLTATPLLNHPRDLGGYLFQICQLEWLIPRLPTGSKEIYLPGYDPRNHGRRLRVDPLQRSRTNSQTETEDEEDNDTLRPIQNLLEDVQDLPQRQAYLQALTEGYPLHIFDVRNYRTTGYYSEWSPEVCRTMMHAILPCFMLRIGNGTEIDMGPTEAPYVVGEDIPKCNFFTLTLEMNEDERVVHDDITLSLLSLLGVGSSGSSYEDKKECNVSKHTASTEVDRREMRDIVESEGIVDQGIYRLLKHVTLDPNLAKLTLLNHRDAHLTESSNVVIPHRNNWTGQDTDNGASYYFIRTRDHPKYALPQDVLTLAHYMVSLSPKLRWLIGRLAPLVFKQKKKAVVISEFPMTQWDIEANLTNLGFTYAAINSKMTQEERSAVIEDFNDPSSGTMILLITTTLGSVSLNLQAACSHVYIMDIPIRFYDIVQILGRVHRIGQRSEQNVYMLYLQDSFDQYCLARMIRKMVASLGGEGTTFTDDHISIDAQNKLMLWLGLQYSMHDPCWSMPPWRNRSIHIDIAERMRKATGGFLYRSDALQWIAPDAFQTIYKEKETPSKSRRTATVSSANRRIQNIKAPQSSISENESPEDESAKKGSATDKAELDLIVPDKGHDFTIPTIDEDDDLYDATPPRRPTKQINFEDDSNTEDEHLIGKQLSTINDPNPSPALESARPEQADVPDTLPSSPLSPPPILTPRDDENSSQNILQLAHAAEDNNNEMDDQSIDSPLSAVQELPYPPGFEATYQPEQDAPIVTTSGSYSNVIQDAKTIHTFQCHLKHRDTLHGVSKGRFTKQIKSFVLQEIDVFQRLGYDVSTRTGPLIVPELPDTIENLPEYQALGPVIALTFNSDLTSETNSLKRTNSASPSHDEPSKRVRV